MPDNNLFSERKTNTLYSSICIVVIGVLFCFSAAGCATPKADTLYSPPSLLLHTTKEMKTAGFWISRHPYPDKVILSLQEISRLNLHIQDELKLTADVLMGRASINKEDIIKMFHDQLESLKKSGFTHLNGGRISDEYWRSIEEVMNLKHIPSKVHRQFGFIVHYTDERFLPTEEGMYAKAYDSDFDELQNNALDIGTLVAILHGSNDGKWLYTTSSASSGWVKAENVARIENEELFKKFIAMPVAVVVSPKADIYLNQQMTRFIGSALMGVALPFIKEHDGSFEVLIPLRQSNGTAALVPGFIASDQVHEGYLPYTARNILLQAFKMLHQPYGWGGMYGEQDCSRFLQEVFATVGIKFPRNSKEQIKVGELLASWQTPVPNNEKLMLLKEKAVGGVTILGMKGHIMLYLGNVDDKVYAIHSVWAFRQPNRQKKDNIFVINRVAVSDLSLGEGSKKGSLLDRLNAVKFIGNKF